MSRTKRIAAMGNWTSGARAVDIEHDVSVLKPQPTPGNRNPYLVSSLLGTEKNSIPVQARRQGRELGPLGGQADGIHDTARQHSMGFGVDANRSHLTVPCDGRATVAVAVR